MALWCSRHGTCTKRCVFVFFLVKERGGEKKTKSDVSSCNSCTEEGGKKSAGEDLSRRSPKYSPVKNFVPKNEGIFSLLHLIWLMLRQICLPCCLNHLLWGDKSRGESCWDQKTHGENVMENGMKIISQVLAKRNFKKPSVSATLARWCSAAGAYR